MHTIVVCIGTERSLEENVCVLLCSMVKYTLRSVNKGKSKTLHAIAKAERVVERGTVGFGAVGL